MTNNQKPNRIIKYILLVLGLVIAALSLAFGVWIVLNCIANIHDAMLGGLFIIIAVIGAVIALAGIGIGILCIRGIRKMRRRVKEQIS